MNGFCVSDLLSSWCQHNKREVDALGQRQVEDLASTAVWVTQETSTSMASEPGTIKRSGELRARGYGSYKQYTVIVGCEYTCCPKVMHSSKGESIATAIAVVGVDFN